VGGGGAFEFRGGLGALVGESRASYFADVVPHVKWGRHARDVQPLPMTDLTDEHRRALQLLARHPDGCAEAELLADGLSIGQLTDLVIDGFAKMQPTVTALGECEKIVVWVLITAAGRKAIAG
jgi:hypothetical protein